MKLLSILALCSVAATHTSDDAKLISLRHRIREGNIITFTACVEGYSRIIRTRTVTKIDRSNPVHLKIIDSCKPRYWPEDPFQQDTQPPPPKSPTLQAVQSKAQAVLNSVYSIYSWIITSPRALFFTKKSNDGPYSKSV